MTQEVTGEVAAPAAAKDNSRWWALAVISLAQLMVTLDSTIIAVALPSAQRAVGLSDVGRQWTITAYAVAFGGFLLLGGRIGDLLGRRRSLMIGMIGFAVASGLGGAAANAGMLIGARGLQGLFAALIAPSTLSLISITFTDTRERAKAFGVFTATSMCGGATGLILGGVLTDFVDWRWCLYVNIPIVVVAVIGVLTVLPTVPPREGVTLDVPGAVLGTAGMLALIFGLGEAAAYDWGSPLIIGALLAAVLLLSAFIYVQSRVTNPLLPLRVLANRNSGGAFLAMAIAAFCMLGMFLGMTYQMQSVMGYSPVKTGLAFLAYIVPAALYSTQVASRLLLHVKPGLMIGGGLLLAAVGLFLLTRLTTQSDYLTDVFPALLLFGIGVGNLAVPIFSTAMAAADARDAGIVSAVVNTSQQIGGSIGVALLNTVSVSAAASYLASHAGADRAQGAVQGLSVACAWAAGMAVFGAVLAVTLITVDPRRKAAAKAA